MNIKSRTKRAVAALLCTALLLQAAGASAASVFQYRIPLKGGSATYNPSKGEIASLVATPSSVVAGSGTAVALVARVQDKANLPATPGQTVEWSSTGGSFAQGTSPTLRGAASGVFAPPETVGTYTVTGTLTSNSATSSTTVNVVANASAAVVSSLSSASPVVAAGGRSTTVSALVRDVYGNALGAGIPVRWSTDRGTLSAETSNSDSTGLASVTISSSAQAGVAHVLARAASADTGLVTNVTFEADAATARVVELTTDKDTLVADGVTTAQLTARLHDANGNPVGAGVAVAWSTDNGTVSPSTTTTQAGGIASTTLTSGTSAGVGVARAAAAEEAGSTVAVTMVANPATARVNGLSATQTSILADGVSTTTLTATVLDVNGNPVGAGVPVRWSSDRGTLSSTTSSTNASGAAVATLTSGIVAGPATVQAFGASGDAGRSTSVTFASDTATAKVASVSANATFLPANGTAQAQFAATLRDVRGNLAPAGVTVRWTTTAGTLLANTSVTDANGVAWVYLKASTVKTVATVSAFGVTSDLGSSRNISFDADATTARVVTASSNVATIFGNNSAVATLSAVVQDANGNAVGSGVTVNWSASQGALSAATSTTNAQGAATVQLRSGSAGVGPTATVTARGVAGDTGRTATVRFTSDARWQFNVASYGFPDTPASGTADISVAIYNIGTTPEAPTLTPTGYFGVVSGCGVINPGAYCIATVRFYPPGTAYGFWDGTLTASGPGGSAAMYFSGHGMATVWQGGGNSGTLMSTNGYYRFIVQGDCNMVIYAGNSHVWDSGTQGRTGCTLAVQGDGNLVLYTNQGVPFHIGQHPTDPNPWLEMGNDGRVYFWGAAKGNRSNLLWVAP